MVQHDTHTHTHSHKSLVNTIEPKMTVTDRQVLIITQAKEILLGLSFKSKTWCNRVKLELQLYLFIVCIDIDLSILDPSWLGCIKSCTKDISHRFLTRWPQLVHGFRQSSRDCSTLPPNWRDEFPRPSRWVFHSECISVMITY